DAVHSAMHMHEPITSVIEEPAPSNADVLRLVHGEEQATARVVSVLLRDRMRVHVRRHRLSRLAKAHSTCASRLCWRSRPIGLDVCRRTVGASEDGGGQDNEKHSHRNLVRRSRRSNIGWRTLRLDASSSPAASYTLASSKPRSAG